MEKGSDQRSPVKSREAENKDIARLPGPNFMYLTSFYYNDERSPDLPKCAFSNSIVLVFGKT